MAELSIHLRRLLDTRDGRAVIVATVDRQTVTFTGRFEDIVFSAIACANKAMADWSPPAPAAMPVHQPEPDPIEELIGVVPPDVAARPSE